MCRSRPLHADRNMEPGVARASADDDPPEPEIRVRDAFTRPAEDLTASPSGWIEGPGRALLEALPVAVYTTDAAGRITFFNSAAVALWGSEPELGKTEFTGAWKLFWSDGSPMRHNESPMAQALAQGKPIRG